MSDSIGPFDGTEPPDPQQPGGPSDTPPTEQVQLRGVGARVPAHVARGVFSTGAIVMTGATEFVVDFVQRMGRPHHVIARVVMPHAVMARFIGALEQNIQKYEGQFGAPKELPKPTPQQQMPRQSVQDVYEELKLPDEMLSGAYANGVLIGHSGAEFSFDFITNFFPNSAVSCRVYMAASHVPPMLGSLKNSFQQFQERVKQAQQQQQGQQGQPGQVKPPDEPPSDQA